MVVRWATVFALLVVDAMSGAAASPTSSPGLLVYFDPDANHQAILSITSRFSGYLAEKNVDLEFQPVQTRDALRALLADERTRFAIVNPSYSGAEIDSLLPLLVPTKQGDPYYHKVLLDNGGGASGESQAKTVAAALPVSNTVEAAQSLLALLPSRTLNVNTVSTVAVTKDIDALLALSFRQVDAALVTPASLEVLKRINPVAAQEMRVVSQTKPILRSPLYAVGKRTRPDERDNLIATLRAMGENELGRSAMNTMGIDGWVSFLKVAQP